MKTWCLIMTLTLGVLAQSSRAEEIVPGPLNGSSCQKPGCGKQCSAASIWDFLCYRPARLPRECRSCISPARACTPPLYLYFVHRYPTFNNEPAILVAPNNADQY